MEFNVVTLSGAILNGNYTLVKNVQVLPNFFNQIVDRRQTNIAIEIRLTKSKCVEKKKNHCISKYTRRM